MPVRPGALPRTFGAELDPQARIEVWEAVRELARGGTTILLTTQYLDEAEQLADRIAILHEGRIIAEGMLDDLKRRFPPARVEYIEKQPLTGRSLRHILRSPDTIVTTAVMPIAFLLLFVFVFGGAIQTGGESYVSYLLPGIRLITVASGVAYTAYRLFPRPAGRDLRALPVDAGRSVVGAVGACPHVRRGERGLAERRRRRRVRHRVPEPCGRRGMARRRRHPCSCPRSRSPGSPSSPGSRRRPSTAPARSRTR